MTLEEIVKFCSDDYNMQFTFDYSVTHLLANCPGFFGVVRDTIYNWDYDIDKYITGETISFTDNEYSSFAWSVHIKFDTHTKAFIITS